MPLRPHQRRAGQPELHARERVDGVINAPVVGTEAAEQTAVGGVHNRVAPQRRQVAPPEVQPRADRAQVGGVGDTPAPQLLLQIRVLHPQKRLSDRRRRAQIQQRTQQKPLSVRIGGSAGAREGVRSRSSAASKKRLLSSCVMPVYLPSYQTGAVSGVEKARRHIQIILPAVRRIPLPHLGLEGLGAVQPAASRLSDSR